MPTTIQYAQWEDLPPAVQSVFAGFTGKGLADGQKLYELYFYGYNIPHELGHILRSIAGTRSDLNYDEEINANRFAVAFWRARRAVNLLRQVEETLRLCLARLPDPLPPGEDRADYFNKHQRELIDPPKYGHYQFNMVLSALARPESFTQVLQALFNLTPPPEESVARSLALGDPIISPDLPAQTLAEIRSAMEAFGLPLPEITLQRIYTPALQRVIESV